MEKFKNNSRDKIKKMREKIKPHGAKFWLNVVTIFLIFLVIIFARKNIEDAFYEIGNANLFILALIIPAQFLSFFAETEIFFTYLRGRGQLKNTSRLEATSMSLEMNFVNHVFPSGGVSGVGYMNWRMGKFGVSAGQATLSQLIKYVIQFSTFFVLLFFALLWATVDDNIPNWIVAGGVFGISALIFIIVFGGFLISSDKRMKSFAHWLTKNINAAFAKITRGRKNNLLKRDVIERFFMDFYNDYNAIRADKKLLVKPVIWAFIVNFSEIAMFAITFWALGYWVNPVILLIAYGAGQVSGIFMITPGGAGAVEAIMITILTASGLLPSAAFAGIILARVILVIITLISGFFVYQRALHKYGKYNGTKEDDENIIERLSDIDDDNLEESFVVKPAENKVKKLDEIDKSFHNKNNKSKKNYEKNEKPKLNLRDRIAQKRELKAANNDLVNAQKLDEKFAKKLEKQNRKKIKLSKTEEREFAEMNITDIEIDGEDL